MAHRRSRTWWIAALLAAAGTAAAAAAVLATSAGDGERAARGLVLVALLAPVCVIDLDRRLIPNPLTTAGALAAIALTLATDAATLPAALAWAAGAGGFLLLPALIRPDAMGMGDVKLAAVLGLMLGPAVVPALLVGLVAATVAGGLLLARDLVGPRRAGARAPPTRSAPPARRRSRSARSSRSAQSSRSSSPDGRVLARHAGLPACLSRPTVQALRCPR